ncbi:hypothetical protein H2199_007707 [Coniosporium tulheliwenetii]|uniref:Uncharacterized protein n=1 Tax=Coniosporium tulheliwenetii TaxID=3383036 RepID=A0ACC2YNJ2_9PEZI|nr:hypothetical protein H2199_007707 [Cladosporium sp. JES 115]
MLETMSIFETDVSDSLELSTSESSGYSTAYTSGSDDINVPASPATVAAGRDRPQYSQCPVKLGALQEFELIKERHPVLASTGCTAQFCQAGRAIHTSEPRIGFDRPLEEVQLEATSFLQEMRLAGAIQSDQELDHRLKDVIQQIHAGAIQTTFKTDHGTEYGLAGGNWAQTAEELEFGTRLAWKNARKCIMRSQYQELKLCDLRHIVSSAEMGPALIKSLAEAFNGGKIQPTVFVFPPRDIGQRGPMIWNQQLLAFAGWDLLPLVTMGENDEPAIFELPDQLKQLVHIRHPRYQKDFEQLDLRWVGFPALSKLGFDIGGIQYTAAPFAGWFMDAEIGVRDLADTFRYNALPKVAQALKLYDQPARELDELPEYERLAALPKPLICRHTQDPVKAWKRERRHKSLDAGSVDSAHAVADITASTGKRITAVPSASRIVRIHYCSSGITAAKLASKLYSRLCSHANDTSSNYRVLPAATLNELDIPNVQAEDVILLIVSTTGRGEMPLNGAKFALRCQKRGMATKARFTLFGNGDSSYGDTFNAAASTVAESLTSIGAQPIAGGLFEGDTACENPPWTALEEWWNRIQLFLSGKQLPLIKESKTSRGNAQPLFRNFAQATLVGKSEKSKGIVRVTLSLGRRTYQEMDHIKILPPNRSKKILCVTKSLAVCPEHPLPFAADLSVYSYLRFVDLDLPFRSLGWLSKITGLMPQTQASLSSKHVPEVLELLSHGGFIPLLDINEICRSMPLLVPRTFSIASSPSHLHPKSTYSTSRNLVDLLVKIQPHGRFSTNFLGPAEPGETMRYMICASPAWPMLDSSIVGPTIAIATGSGLAPLRGLLQKRVAAAKASGPSATSDACTRFAESPISLFIGHRAVDVDIVEEAIADAKHFAVLDIVSVVLSNSDGIRIQDKLLEDGIAERVAAKLRHPGCRVFVCANPAAAEATVLNLSSLLGEDVKAALGDRYLEEVYGIPAGVSA